jgi:hypothetical protein
LRWRVAPVPVTFSTRDAGAPSPWLLGTGEVAALSLSSRFGIGVGNRGHDTYSPA